VVPSEEGLPDELKALVKGSRVAGVYVPLEDQVYLVAGSLENRAAVERAVLHEVMGHAGLRRVLGREQYGTVMDGIARSMPDEVRAKAEEYELDLTTLEGRQEAADEVLAEWASRGEPAPRPLARAVMTIRGWLRKLFPNLTWTPDEVRTLLAKARTRVERGTGGERTSVAPRFSRALEARMSLVPGDKGPGKGSPQNTPQPDGGDEFRRWFGRSRVVDSEGLPRIVYHGTSGDHSVFDSRFDGAVSSGAGHGFWFALSAKYAFEYAENADGIRGERPRVMRAYLSVQNPLEIRVNGREQMVVDGHPMEEWESNDDALRYAKKHGHDGVIFWDGSFTDDPSVVVFRPEQIRLLEDHFRERPNSSAARGAPRFSRTGASGPAQGPRRENVRRIYQALVDDVRRQREAATERFTVLMDELNDPADVLERRKQGAIPEHSRALDEMIINDPLRNGWGITATTPGPGSTLTGTDAFGAAITQTRTLVTGTIDDPMTPAVDAVQHILGGAEPSRRIVALVQ